MPHRGRRIRRLRLLPFSIQHFFGELKRGPTGITKQKGGWVNGSPLGRQTQMNVKMHTTKRERIWLCTLVPELRVSFLLSVYWTCRIGVYFFSRFWQPIFMLFLVNLMLQACLSISLTGKNPKWEDEREGIHSLFNPALFPISKTALAVAFGCYV